MENQVNNNSNTQALVSTDDARKIVYKVGEEEVTLSRAIVRQYLCRGEAAGVSDAEIVQFMALCRANGLNPFVGDAYLVKYKNSPAQMITSKNAFMKRAEAGADYQGFTAGVIVVRNNEVVELEGAFCLPSDTLVGGWCRVLRKDRQNPIVARVSLREYHTDKSTWAAKPATMIRKVAIAQAFREAYPVNLGGLYVPEEEAPEDQVQPAPPAVPANCEPAPLPDPEEEKPAVPAEKPQDAREAEERPDTPPAADTPAETDGEAGFDMNLFNPDFAQ